MFKFDFVYLFIFYLLLLKEKIYTNLFQEIFQFKFYLKKWLKKDFVIYLQKKSSSYCFYWKQHFYNFIKKMYQCNYYFGKVILKRKEFSLIY